MDLQGFVNSIEYAKSAHEHSRSVQQLPLAKKTMSGVISASSQAAGEILQQLTDKDKDRLHAMIADTNKQLYSTSLVFEYIETAHRFYIQVINRDTQEVVREIPPRKFLEMALDSFNIMMFNKLL